MTTTTHTLAQDGLGPPPTAEEAIERVRAAFAAYKAAQTRMARVRKPEAVVAARRACIEAEAQYRAAAMVRDVAVDREARKTTPTPEA